MSASENPNDIVSYPAPKPNSEFVPVPAPPKPFETQVATGPVTVTYKITSDDAAVLIQGARAQVWSAEILIVAVAVFAINKVGSIIAAQKRLPPPLPENYFSNWSKDP